MELSLMSISIQLLTHNCFLGPKTNSVEKINLLRLGMIDIIN